MLASNSFLSTCVQHSRAWLHSSYPMLSPWRRVQAMVAASEQHWDTVPPANGVQQPGSMPAAWIPTPGLQGAGACRMLAAGHAHGRSVMKD